MKCPVCKTAEVVKFGTDTITGEDVGACEKCGLIYKFEEEVEDGRERISKK